MTAPPPPQPELDDFTLARAQKGDPTAWQALVQRYQRPVFAALSRILGPAGKGNVCEDLAQETFLRAFRALPAFEANGPARLSTWLLTIATRLALDEVRRRGFPLEEPKAAEQVRSPLDADHATAVRLLARTLGEAAEKMGAQQRAVLVLHAFHGLAHQEIAAILGVEVATVKSRLSRARALLRQAMGEHE
jgi:RNA polymerase sigma-70 factor, ECF subfamily